MNSISEPIEQIEPDRTQSIRLCPIGFGSRTQSNGLRPFEYGEKIRLNKNVMLSQKHEKYELYWSNSSLETLVIDFQHQKKSRLKK